MVGISFNLVHLGLLKLLLCINNKKVIVLKSVMSPKLQTKEDEAGEEKTSSESENPFGIQTPNYKGELFGSAETDWEESDALEEVLEGNPGFEEDEEFENLPDSGSALLHHDLSNYFQIGINTSIKDGETVPEFSAEVHFEEDDDLTEIDGIPWEEQGIDVVHDRDDLGDAYCTLRENPSSRNAIRVFEEAAHDGLPQAAEEVAYRAEQVAKAARGYDNIRGSPKPDAFTTLEDAIWAFDKFQGIDLSIQDGLSKNQEIHGNEAMKFISSTFVQNAYENDVDGDTSVQVNQNEEGDVEVIYESQVDGQLPQGIEDDIFEYDASTEGGFGIPASKYIVERFEGSMTYEGDKDTFGIKYTLQSE